MITPKRAVQAYKVLYSSILCTTAMRPLNCDTNGQTNAFGIMWNGSTLKHTQISVMSCLSCFITIQF